jgi:hypothetical protein
MEMDILEIQISRILHFKRIVFRKRHISSSDPCTFVKGTR